VQERRPRETFSKSLADSWPVLPLTRPSAPRSRPFATPMPMQSIDGEAVLGTGRK